MFYVIRQPGGPLGGVATLRIGVVPDNFRRRRLLIGKGMSEVAIVRGSPDSDCNSNHHGSTSYLSNTSSQDIDFIQDNSDYQWFLDYGYRDGGSNHHTSILSLPESYEAGDVNYYEVFSKNMDANLAEADMESFRTEDIHALLTNLPPMCSDHLSQENNRLGECFASVSGSMMGKFDLDSSISPHSSSQGDECSANSNSMSICKSELLFSPVKETPVPVNFSVDSLDCDFHDMMLTCQANKDNYTIAFEGSVTMYSEDSDYRADKSSDSHQTDSSHWPGAVQSHLKHLKTLDSSMTKSDSSSLTTWSKLKKRNSEDHLRRPPSGNNNNNSGETSHLALAEATAKSQSMPNLYKHKLRNLLVASGCVQSQSNSSTETNTVKRRPVKLFDIQHQVNQSSSASVSDMATSVDASCSDNTNNKQTNFSLVKLFMKQKSMSVEGMSTTMDQLSSTENWPGSQSGESNTSEPKDNNIAEVKTSDSSVRTYDLIAEEPEDEDISTRSESVEQISESLAESFDKDKRNISIQTSHFSEINNLKTANKTCLEASQQRPLKLIEPSFLNKLKMQGEVEKPVYVLYPNYVLPDLDFLKQEKEEVFLVPQPPPNAKDLWSKRRPFSCDDLESLKKRGFSHVQDWDSLNFLLPQEYRKILADVPEVSAHMNNYSTMREKPSFLQQQNQKFGKRRTVSCEINQSSSSSTATQPSSGFRGSSSILTDSSQNSPAPMANLNPLFVYRYDSVTSSEASLLNSERQRSVTTMAGPPLPMRSGSLPQGDNLPPRPPLPRGILRRDKIDPSKRYSMYETSEEENNTEDTNHKRKSLPDPYFLARNKRLSETEDEGVDAGASSSSLDEHPDNNNSSHTHHNFVFGMDELTQLEEFLKLSGISSKSTDEEGEDGVEKNLSHLRSYVGRFLSLKINQDGGMEHLFGGRKCVSFAEKVNLLPNPVEGKQLFDAPNNSPNVSAFLHQKHYQPKNLHDMPITEEHEHSPNYSTPQTTPIHHNINKTLSPSSCSSSSDNNFLQKRSLISAVIDATNQLKQHFSLATSQLELNMLGDSSINPAGAKLALTTLCPALYAILSDGLKPTIDSSFGAINNSVWQVVEASAQQGPLTKALNELVMRINSESAITEGVVKFNAFVFGLLNVRSLDAWTSYLRTRESVLRRHYESDALLVMAHTGGVHVRGLLDAMVAALQPLAFLPVQWDLLFELKELHRSFKRMDSFCQRPLSPACKHHHSPSMNFKQFTTNTNRHLKSPTNRSDTEDENTIHTVRNNSPNKDTAALPDLLNTPSSTTASPKSKAKERPRSCVDSRPPPTFKLGEDINNIVKKRWSSIAPSSKLYQAFDRLAKEEEEEYTDSLENNPDKANNSEEAVTELESLDSNFAEDKPLNGRRFKRLQQKWEMLSGQNSTESPPLSPKSKIPRPIVSPVRPSGIPVPVSPAGVKAVGCKIATKKVTTPPAGKACPLVKGVSGGVKSSLQNRAGPSARTSRVDLLEQPRDTPRHIQRPSSLPYKPTTPQNGKTSKIIPPRRAASSSLSRRPLGQSSTPKFVRALSHRLPSESGHLSFNEGERLRVVLEVDEKWWLCCRGTQKGLVPKSAVIADSTGRF